MIEKQKKIIKKQTKKYLKYKKDGIFTSSERNKNMEIH